MEHKTVGVSAKGSNITVIGHYRGKLKLLECDRCSPDKEMWNGNDVIFGRYTGKDNRFTCSCFCGNTVLSERQRALQVEMVAKELGYVFLGWHGEYNSGDTKLKLYNPVSGNQWNTCNVSNFLKGRKDPTMKGTRRIDDDVFINRFKADFKDYYNYERIQVGRWAFDCRVCAEDDFSKLGGLPYRFEASTGAFGSSSLFCRCSGSHVNTLDEWNYLVSSICNEMCIRMLTTLEDGCTSKTRLNWICKEGHVRSNILECFIRNSGSCRKCNSGCNGYYPKRVDEQDNLYVYLFDDSYLKVGRSFNLKDREKSLKQASDTKDLKLILSYKGEHKNVYDTEQYIHSILRDHNLSFPTQWTIESFKLEGLCLIEELLDCSILKPTLDCKYNLPE